MQTPIIFWHRNCYHLTEKPITSPSVFSYVLKVVRLYSEKWCRVKLNLTLRHFFEWITEVKMLSLIGFRYLHTNFFRLNSVRFMLRSRLRWYVIVVNVTRARRLSQKTDFWLLRAFLQAAYTDVRKLMRIALFYTKKIFFGSKWILVIIGDEQNTFFTKKNFFRVK